MLSDDSRQLLTAYVDGQLGARQRKTVLRLLRKSPEARQLLQQMQQDASALGGLPAARLPADFSLQVLRVIAQRGLRPGTSRVPLPARAIPGWVGVAAAAAILLLVGTASFVYLGDGLEPRTGQAFLDQPGLPVPDPDLIPRPNPFVDSMAAETARRFALPVKPGVEFALRNLQEGREKTRLATELKKDTAYHVELETTSSARAVERLASAFRGKGIQLLMEPAAQTRLKKKQPKVSYLVYAENLSPDELAAILQQMGEERATPVRPEPAGENVLFNPMTGEHRTHLSKLLGLPAARLQPARKLAPGEVFVPLHEPIHVPPKVGGKGMKGKSDGAAPPKGPERFAVVLAYNSAGGNAAASDAVRRFVRHRESPRPGSLQVYLVVHEASV